MFALFARVNNHPSGSFAAGDSLKEGRFPLPFQQKKQSHVRQPQQAIALSFERLAQFSPLRPFLSHPPPVIPGSFLFSPSNRHHLTPCR